MIGLFVGCRRMPRAPLIQNQTDLAMWIDFIQGSTLIENQLFDLCAAMQQLVPLIGAIFGRGARRAGVVMRGISM